jgi:hypothetical protein
MKKLRVNMLGLLDGLQTSPRDPIRYYFDLETGEVTDILVPDPSAFAELGIDEEERQTFESNPDRYNRVPNVSGRTQYRWMEEFVDGVEEPEITSQLRIALAGRGAFSRFRQVLGQWPDLEQRWQALRRELLVQEVCEWLASLDVEPEYELPAMESPPPSSSSGGLRSKVSLIHLLAIGTLGAELGVVDGKVHRVIRARTPSDARGLFRSFAREWCEMRGIGWRNRFIEGKNEFELEDLTLRVNDTAVEACLRVPTEIQRAIGP